MKASEFSEAFCNLLFIISSKASITNQQKIMKKLVVLSALVILSVSCKETNTTENKNYSKETLDVTTSVYPENISNVFTAHGSIDAWNSFENLVFEIEKDGVNEKTTTTLKNRFSVIDAETFAIGFDGKEVWLQEKDTATYKGNARFYYNLMFYFYAMPFVVADDGIIYENVEALQFDGKSYPGIKISYEAGVGESPEDEYIVYYDSETNKMEWLAYTVTYFTKEKSPKFSLIRYSDWQTVEGLQLPKTLQWHDYKDGKIGDVKSERNFVNVSLSKQLPSMSIDATFFKK